MFATIHKEPDVPRRRQQTTFSVPTPAFAPPRLPRGTRPTRPKPPPKDKSDPNLRCQRCGAFKTRGCFYYLGPQASYPGSDPQPPTLADRFGYSPWCKTCFRRHSDTDPSAPFYDECIIAEATEAPDLAHRARLNRALRDHRELETLIYGRPLRQADREPTITMMKARAERRDTAERNRRVRETRTYGRSLLPAERISLAQFSKDYRDEHRHSASTHQRQKFFSQNLQKTLDTAPRIPHTTPQQPQETLT